MAVSATEDASVAAHVLHEPTLSLAERKSGLSQLLRLQAEQHEQTVITIVAELQRTKDDCRRLREQVLESRDVIEDADGRVLAAVAEVASLKRDRDALQREVERLTAENSALIEQSAVMARELESFRELANAAMEETGRTRSILQHTIRTGTIASPAFPPMGGPHEDTTLSAAQSAVLERASQLASQASTRSHQRQPAVIRSPFVEHGPLHFSRDAKSPADGRAGSVDSGRAVSAPAQPTISSVAARPLIFTPGPSPVVVARRSDDESPLVEAAAAGAAMQMREPRAPVGEPTHHAVLLSTMPVATLTSAASPTNPVAPLRGSVSSVNSRIGHVYACDADTSRGVSLSNHRHVAVAVSPGATCVYTEALSRADLCFEAVVRSFEPVAVVVGVTSVAERPAELDVPASVTAGRPALLPTPARCCLRGDGTALVSCAGSAIESSVELPPVRTIAVRWSTALRTVTFVVNGSTTLKPLLLPQAFSREALCPFVVLPCRGDEVVVKTAPWPGASA